MFAGNKAAFLAGGKESIASTLAQMQNQFRKQPIFEIGSK
jgi:hypothetical protein